MLLPFVCMYLMDMDMDIISVSGDVIGMVLWGLKGDRLFVWWNKLTCHPLLATILIYKLGDSNDDIKAKS